MAAAILTTIQKTLITILTLPTLVACGAAPTKIEPTIPVGEVKQTVNIDAYLLKPCPTHLAKPARGAYNQGQSLDIVSAWDGQLSDCGQRHNKLVEVVVKAFNIKEIPPPDTVVELQPRPVNKQ